MTEPNSLRLAPRGAAPRTPEHKRFYTLIGQIEKARASLAAWHAQVLLFRQDYLLQLAPLRAELLGAVSQWVFAIDAALAQRGWTRGERTTLRKLLCANVAELLKIKPTDALKELFAKHSKVDFDTSQREELEMLKEMTEMFTGVDMGDTSNLDSEQDLMAHIAEKMAAHEEQRRGRTDAREKRPKAKSAAQLRREDEAQRVTQSVREVFRKLASALHPDREPDPEARATKNALMQKVNQAYEANDLLTLLEVQLQIEQVSPAQIQNADVERVRRYNKVLAEQLASLKAERGELRAQIELEFNLQLAGNDPRELAPWLAQKQRQLELELVRQQREVRTFSDMAATKQWLKQRRRELRRAEDFDDFP